MNKVFLKKIQALLIRHEGLRTHPYRDIVGKLTIGVGRNLDDVGITVEEAMFLLENDIRKAIRDLEAFDFFDKLDDVRQAVLIDMIFNLGKGKFMTFKRMIRALKEGNYDKAAEEMETSKWCNQVGNRCKELVRMMRTGRWII